MAEKLDSDFDIPIKRTDLTIFDDAVSTIKERFITEMKKMDEEINKFSSDLLRLYAHSSIETASTEAIGCQSPLKSQCNWESLASSPLVESEGDQKTLKLQFDVSQFDPAEVTVKILNETLVISASHEEKSDGSSLFRQFHRKFKFPKGVDPEAVNSTISKDGILTVAAPLPQLGIIDK